MKKISVFIVTLVLVISCFGQNVLAASEDSPEINELQIGHQAVKVSDVTLTETSAGMLQKGRQVRISLSDHISQDLFFHPDFEIEITGDLKIRNPRTNFVIGSHSPATRNAEHYICFEIEKASTVPSIIKLSNLYVKVDRTVPTSSAPYDLIIWGDAVAGNLGQGKEQFRNAGIKVPYAMVADPETKTPYLDAYSEVYSSDASE